MLRVLLLGGTTEAGLMAAALAAAGVDAVYSLAGRTKSPTSQPLPMRVGGFGGIEGLAAYLRDTAIQRVIDATHPFAAAMSGNAIAACKLAEVALIALERPAWSPQPDDNWTNAPDFTAAIAGLSGPARRVFLAIGRQNIALFAAQPQHHYLLRLVDAPAEPLVLPNFTVVLDRGPFDLAGDLALMQSNKIEIVVAKNSGGKAAAAKLAAARELGLPVLMIARPVIGDRQMARSVADVMHWLDHPARLGV